MFFHCETNKLELVFQIEKFGLKLENDGFYHGYDSSIDPSIGSSFSAAAYRFGHSQIRDLMSRYGERYTKKHAPVHTDNFFDPAPIYDLSQGGVDGLIRGLAKDHSQKVDGCVQNKDTVFIV